MEMYLFGSNLWNDQQCAARSRHQASGHASQQHSGERSSMMSAYNDKIAMLQRGGAKNLTVDGGRAAEHETARSDVVAFNRAEKEGKFELGFTDRGRLRLENRRGWRNDMQQNQLSIVGFGESNRPRQGTDGTLRQIGRMDDAFD